MAEIKSPLKAIRAKCLECSGDYINEVRECPITDCPLYAFRFGKNPYLAGRKISEEQKAEMLKNLKRYRGEIVETS